MPVPASAIFRGDEPDFDRVFEHHFQRAQDRHRAAAVPNHHQAAFKSSPHFYGGLCFRLALCLLVVQKLHVFVCECPVTN